MSISFFENFLKDFAISQLGKHIVLTVWPAPLLWGRIIGTFYNPSILFLKFLTLSLKCLNIKQFYGKESPLPIES